jgi:hypothetical protein
VTAVVDRPGDDPEVIPDAVQTEERTVLGNVTDLPGGARRVPEVTNPIRPDAPPFRPTRVIVTYARRVEDDGAIVGPWRIRTIRATNVDGGHATWSPASHELPGWLRRFADRCQPADPAHVYTDLED